MARTFQVIVEFDPDEDVWVTYLPALNMLSTYGETREESLVMTEEAIQGYLGVVEQEGIAVLGGARTVELVQLDVVA